MLRISNKEKQSIHPIGIGLLSCLAGILLLFCVSAVLFAQVSTSTKIDKAFISFRIGITQSLPEKRFQTLLDLLGKYPGVTDEITLFTSETHPPLPLDVFARRIDILEKRMVQARERGYRSGINILSTIGHHEENLDNSLKGPFTPMTDIDGKVCRGSFCPNDDNLRAYIQKIMLVTAQANPDYIWLDDDIRLAGHMPIFLTCFCDHCLAIFADETGMRYSREEFKKAANEGSIEEKVKIRKAWLQHNRNTIARLFSLIEETVHGSRPQVPLGFMTGDRFFEGYDFDNWAKILAGPHHTPVFWRPGGGFYQDANTSDLAGKSHDVGRQVSMLPDEVVSIQSEIENFPYQRLKKAANIVVLEACSHIAAGCTGAAFNVVSMYDEPLDEYEPLIARLHQARPFFDLMAKTLGRSKITGVYLSWNKDSFITANLTSGSWFSPTGVMPAQEMYDIGLPICYADKSASVVVLSKSSVYALSKEEIQDILSRGVYLDAETVQHLCDLGFGDLIGFEVVRAEKMDRIEKFSNHPLNGDFANRERDNRQSFWNMPAYTLKKTSPKAEVLAGLIDYADQDVGSCTMGIFENRLGGRVCVAGYYPLTFLQNLSKSSQMKSVFRWLAKDTLPGYIASFHKINLWIRQPQNGRIALAFTNASFDAAENIVLLLRTDGKSLKVYDMNCLETIIPSSGSDGPYQKFIIPFVDPWQIRLAVAEP